MGISYIAEFVSDIAKDSGYSALSNQIQIYGKITILVVSVPILESLINCINGLLLEKNNISFNNCRNNLL